MPTRARELEPEKGPTRAEQIARIRAAMSYRGIQKKELARKMKASRNTITAHLKPGKRPIASYYVRKYEEALGLPRLALDSGTPQEVTALLQFGSQRVMEHQQAPFAGGQGDVSSTLGFVREQLEGYRVRGKLVPPSVVIAWLSELEAAATVATASHERALAASENAS